MLAAAGAYLWAALQPRLAPKISFTEAVIYEWRDEISLRCVVLRRERVLDEGEKAVRFTAAQGERLPAGAVLGLRYSDAGEYFRGALLIRLRGELDARRTAGAEPESVVRRRAAVLARALAAGDFDAANQAALALRLAVSPGEEEAAEALEREIADLEAAGAAEGLVTAPYSCLFSQYADGWEALSPDAAEELTVGDLRAVFAADPRPALSAGRAAAGNEWVLAALTDAGSAARFLPGDRVTLCADAGDFTGEVIRVRLEHDGAAAVFFRCTEGLEAVLDLRLLTVRALLGSEAGLLLDPGAVRGEDGVCFVWRAAGPFLRREEVAVLRRLPEGVLVSAPGLREGDRVAAGDGEFYDGMVY